MLIPVLRILGVVNQPGRRLAGRPQWGSPAHEPGLIPPGGSPAHADRAAASLTVPWVMAAQAGCRGSQTSTR